MYKNIFYSMTLILLTFTSCKKDEELREKIEPITSTSVNIQFDNVFDSLNLELDSVNYILDSGAKLKVITYKYYISNIKLISADNKVYEELESYHLIDAADASSKKIVLNNVPFNTYSSIEYVIGVDSVRNVSGSQAGDLSPNLGMFWSWNTGYIMAKLEGYSQQSGAPDKSLAFHIGGFKGINNALKKVTLNFAGNPLSVTQTGNQKITINCNVKEWFVNPNTISFTNTHNVTSVNQTSKQIADNYADMFSIKSIQN